MNELIEIKQNGIGNKPGVYARELYLGLGLNKTQWSRWSKINIEDSSFFLENQDWQGFDFMSNGNDTRDYVITIDFAKHIAMQAKTSNSHQYRNYMIACESRQQHQLPQTYLEALTELTKVVAEKDAALVTIEHKDQLIIASNEASIKAGEILVREFVKSNDMIDIGEKKFYQWMRDQGLLLKDSCQPYQLYVSRGFFTWKPSEEEYGGKFRYTLRITPRGKIWLASRYLSYLDNDLLIPHIREGHHTSP